jgi:5-(carboxyamino)imidazole ribonucleotide synthase
VTTVLPGATIGVLGSGQLGRMFAIAARRMGYRVQVLSPETDTPTGQVADVEVTAAYDDLEAVQAFAKNVGVVTFEFENVPRQTIDVVDRIVPVRPSALVLHTTQHRLREKRFLRDAGLPVTPFEAVSEEDDLSRVPADLFPGVLKSAAWGYDGKGQARVDSPAELATVWATTGQEAILERLVEFELELSVVAVRSLRGQVACYGPIENLHRNHILDLSLSPARISLETSTRAREIAREIVERLRLVGVLCIEFFLTREGELLVNELAPRPHNSGHLTIDAHATCQFEQQVRAVCGLPLGNTEQFRPAAMANLLGDLWQEGTPRWSDALAEPGVKLHLYGKREAKPQRKMGHLTATADSVEGARDRVVAARRLLCPSQPSRD